MSTPSQAYEAATQTDPSRLELVIRLGVGAVLFLLLAHVLQKLWEVHQDGEIQGEDAGWYATRAAVLALCLLVLLT